MSIIHMETDQVHGLVRMIKLTSHSVTEQVISLRSSSSLLCYSWIGNSQTEFASQFDEIACSLQQQNGLLSQLGQALANEVQQWEEVDASLLSKTGTGLGFGSYVSYELMPIAGGSLALPGLMTSVQFPSLFSIVSGTLQHLELPDWLQKILGLEDQQTSDTSTRPSEPEPQGQSTSGFGELMEKAHEEEAARVKQEGSLYHDVPVQSQGSLYGDAACVPTSICMVLDYMRQQDPAIPMVTPQQLIDGLDPGDGKPGEGIGLNRLNDDLAGLGITNTKAESGGNMETLKEKLTEGPVIVAAGVRLYSNGAVRTIDETGQKIHALVVKGVSEDGSQIIVNDPWSAKELSFETSSFERMWEKGSRAWLTIRP